MIERVLPGGGVLLLGPPTCGDEVLIGEEGLLADGLEGAARARFCTGRHLAHQAIAALGMQRQQVGRRATGAPRWPAGVVGSISHGPGLVAAVAAHAIDIHGVGVDVELLGRITPDVWPTLFTVGEQRWFRGLPARQFIENQTICFSAKEAFLKLPPPPGGMTLDLPDLEVVRDGHRVCVHGRGDAVRRVTGSDRVHGVVERFEDHIAVVLSFP